MCRNWKGIRVSKILILALLFRRMGLNFSGCTA